MQIAWSLTPKKVNLQNWKPVFSVILQFFNIECHGQTSLNFKFCQVLPLFHEVKKLKTLLRKQKPSSPKNLGIFTVSLYQGAKIVFEIIFLIFDDVIESDFGKVCLKCTNFRLFFFSRILLILADLTKLNTHRIFFWTAFAKEDTR